MATVKKIKKAQKGIKATADSSAYYRNLSRDYMQEAAWNMGDGVGKKSRAAMDKSSEATRNEERQRRKGKPGYDANGFPIKKNKTGGITKAKDGKWIQKATASIKKRGTAGKCTPITKPGCTGKAKTLAKTFKKIAAKRKAK